MILLSLGRMGFSFLAKDFALKSMMTMCWLWQRWCWWCHLWWQRWWRWWCWRWRCCSAGCLLPSSALSCPSPPDSKSMATLYLQISYLQFSISAFFCILPFPGFFPFQFQIVSVLKLNIELNLFRCLSWQQVNSRSIFTDILFSISLGACFKLCHQNSYHQVMPVIWSISFCQVVSSKKKREKDQERNVNFCVLMKFWKSSLQPNGFFGKGAGNSSN